SPQQPRRQCVWGVQNELDEKIRAAGATVAASGVRQRVEGTSCEHGATRRWFCSRQLAKALKSKPVISAVMSDRQSTCAVLIPIVKCLPAVFGGSRECHTGRS